MTTEEPKSKHWLQTTPGFLTALSAVIGSVAALFAALKPGAE